MSDPERKKQLQDLAKEVVYLEAEWSDLDAKRLELSTKTRDLGTKLQAMARQVDNELDKE